MKDVEDEDEEEDEDAVAGELEGTRPLRISHILDRRTYTPKRRRGG